MSRRKSVSTGNNAGIKYEDHINRILKHRGLQDRGLGSAGATCNPDGFFLGQDCTYPFEIKENLSADFAQIELDWNAKNHFVYSNKSKNKEFIPILEKAKFLEQINETWTDIPRKFSKPTITQSDRYWDLNHFPDIKRKIGAKLVEQFYESKNLPVNYLQIGGKGFFHMTSDPAHLKVPRLEGEGILRARVKTRDSKKNKYGFLVAIKLRKVQPSSHDIEERDGRCFPFSKTTPSKPAKASRKKDLTDY